MKRSAVFLLATAIVLCIGAALTPVSAQNSDGKPAVSEAAPLADGIMDGDDVTPSGESAGSETVTPSGESAGSGNAAPSGETAGSENAAPSGESAGSGNAAPSGETAETEDGVSSDTQEPAAREYYVGEIVNYTLHTDIAAYINHYPIKSYNIDGHTAVIAEDLIDYGFHVLWNARQKALYISRNDAEKITPRGIVYANRNVVGTRDLEVYYTDIKTYVDGVLVDSYNVGGRTILALKDLSALGEVVWVPEVKAAKVWLEGIPYIDFSPLPAEREREYYPNTGIATYTSVTGEFLIDAVVGGGAISYKYRYTPEAFEEYKDYIRMKDYLMTQTSSNGVISVQFSKGSVKFAVACDPSTELLWLATEDMGASEMLYYTGTDLPFYTSVTGKECIYTIYFDGSATQSGYVGDGGGFVYAYDKASFDRYLAFAGKRGFDMSDYDYSVALNEMTYFCKKGESVFRIIVSYNYNQLCVIPK